MFKFLFRKVKSITEPKVDWFIERYIIGGTYCNWTATVHLVTEDGWDHKIVHSEKYPHSFIIEEEAACWACAQGRIIPGKTIATILRDPGCPKNKTKPSHETYVIEA